MKLDVNGKAVEADAAADTPLLWVLRMNEVPPITVKVMVTDNAPGGVGECGLPPVAPAIANAVAKLSGGKRLRHLPFNAARVKAALA